MIVKRVTHMLHRPNARDSHKEKNSKHAVSMALRIKCQISLFFYNSFIKGNNSFVFNSHFDFIC